MNLTIYVYTLITYHKILVDEILELFLFLIIKKKIILKQQQLSANVYIYYFEIKSKRSF